MAVFQGLPIAFPVGMATRIRAFQHNMSRFWSSGLLCVGEEAPKTLLVLSILAKKQCNEMSNC